MQGYRSNLAYLRNPATRELRQAGQGSPKRPARDYYFEGASDRLLTCIHIYAISPC